MCVLVCPSRVVSWTSWFGVRCGGVWLGLGYCRAPPLLARVLACVCVCVRAPLVPRLSWVGCAVWACVLGSGFSCAPPILVGLLGCVCGRAPAPLAPTLPRGPPVARGCAGVAVGGVCPPPSPLVFFLGGGFVVSVAGRPGLGSRRLCPPISSLPGRVVCFFFPSQRGMCPRVLGVPSPDGPLFSAWCCPLWLGGPSVPFWWVLSSVLSGWGVWPPLVVLVGGVVAVGRSRPPPPVFSWARGFACSSLCLPSAGTRTGWHSVWPFWFAVGGCVLPGRAPAPSVGWVIYTLGSAPPPARLGSGSAGWAVAPGGFVRHWVSRVLSSPRCRF